MLCDVYRYSGAYAYLEYPGYFDKIHSQFVKFWNSVIRQLYLFVMKARSQSHHAGILFDLSLLVVCTLDEHIQRVIQEQLDE